MSATRATQTEPRPRKFTARARAARWFFRSTGCRARLRLSGNPRAGIAASLKVLERGSRSTERGIQKVSTAGVSVCARAQFLYRRRPTWGVFSYGRRKCYGFDPPRDQWLGSVWQEKKTASKQTNKQTNKKPKKKEETAGRHVYSVVRVMQQLRERYQYRIFLSFFFRAVHAVSHIMSASISLTCSHLALSGCLEKRC